MLQHTSTIIKRKLYFFYMDLKTRTIKQPKNVQFPIFTNCTTNFGYFTWSI